MTTLDETQPGAEASSSTKGGEDFVMPCSISQERFWLLDQLSPGNSALNIPIALKLKGPLNVEALQKALEAVVRRHEVLRTSFLRTDEKVMQAISPEARFELRQIDLTDVPQGKKQERLQAEMRAEAVRPMSLTTAPILRPTLVRFDAEDHGLLLTLHHIICDGWANGILIREMGICYQAILEGKPAGLPELPIQYADYAVWQRDWIKTPDFQNQLAYWEKELAGRWLPLDFPTDHPRRTGRMFPAYIETMLLPPELTDRAKGLCKEYDFTLFMVFFAAYASLLHRYTGQTRFIVGTTGANRTRHELENLIGQFANPMMLPTDLSGGLTFRELLHRVRDMSLGAMSHQEVPFESILERLENVSKGRNKPAIQAHFLFQRAFMQPGRYGKLEIAPTPSASPGTTFDFTMGIVERAEGIRLQMEYNTALFENSTIRRLLGHFQRLLEAAVDDPGTPVRDLPLLTEEESGKLQVSLSPKKPLPEGAARPGLDPRAILDDLQSQLDRHFREAASPHGALIEAPPGAIFVVLDRHLRLLPAGVPGGLYLGGIASEAMPGNAFVSGPLDAPSPIPLLHTNCVACNRENGGIELLGQARDFAQINGFRINLRRVEAILLHHPGVLKAAAAVFQPPTEERQIVCYVVPKPDSAPLEKDLRAFLEGKISDFTLPTRIVTVASLPGERQGEVTFELLPQPVSSAEAIRDEKAPPLEAILYQQIMEIWKEILKVPSLTVEDNFFALGGSSLLAFRMMVRIEKLCGRPLPLSLLLTGATISNLARFIVKANKESVAPLVTVQPKGDRPPFFFLHGDWSGGGFYCARLSRRLGQEHPFYALPPYRSEKQSRLTMEEMAAHHVAAIREHTPHGPYFLGGYCIGATVAMEVARQLVEKGEKVTHMLLIDPPLWGTPWVRWVWPFFDKAGDILKWDPRKKFYYFDLYGVPFTRWLRKPLRGKLASICHRLGLARGGESSALTPAYEADEADAEVRGSLDYAIYFLAYSFYTVKPLSVPATLYFPKEALNSRLSWMRHAGQKTSAKITIEMVPGNHITSITQHASELAEKMKKTLDNP
ncbi:MAG TPA: condensation domain-containing protein [Candidatus Methylacidiphilales bacterium]|jgi:pimeloyl-ACP methyl ester carboxylesterase|nr:condensation domain-containing protein [Candidatus Methylacidiphilales bacterium]